MLLVDLWSIAFWISKITKRKGLDFTQHREKLKELVWPNRVNGLVNNCNLRKGGTIKSGAVSFWKKSKRLLTPPLILENYIANFLWQIRFHICEEVWWPDSMKCMHMPSSKCVLFWFFSIQFLKKHSLNSEITILYQFHDQKAWFRAPKICNVNFLIENDPPPLWHFSKNSSDLVPPPFPYSYSCLLSTDRSHLYICFARSAFCTDNHR